MNPASVIILVLILAYCGYVIYRQVKNKKNGGCSGNCAGCFKSNTFICTFCQKRKKPCANCRKSGIMKDRIV